MALLGKISVQLDAVTKGFTAAMKRAEKPVRGFSRAIQRNATRLAAFNDAIGVKATRMLRAFAEGVLRSGVKLAAFTASMAAMIGVALSLGAAISKLASSFKEIDKVTKAADKLGVAVETMVALRVAARRSGVDVDAVGTIVQRFTRRLAEASIGTGEAQDALKELGIDARKLMRLSADEQLLAVADAMGEVGNRGDQVRLAFKLFDTEGVGFLNTLDLMRDNWDGIREETERAGKAFDRVDASKVELANDTVDKLKVQMEGFADVVAVQLSPVITTLGEKLLVIIDNLGGMRNIAIDSFEAMAKGMIKLVVLSKNIAEGFTVVQLQLAKTAQAGQQARLDALTSTGSTGRNMRASGQFSIKDEFAKNVEAKKSVRTLERRLEKIREAPLSEKELTAAFDKLREDIQKRAEDSADKPLDRLVKGEPAEAIEKMSKAAEDTTSSLKEMEKQVAGQFGQVGKTGALAAVGGFSGGIVASGGGRGSRARSVARAQIRARRAPGGANAGMIGGFNTGGVNSTMFGRLNGGANEGFGPGTSAGLMQGGVSSAAVGNASSSMSINGKSTVSDEKTHTLLERLITDIRFTIGGGSKAVAG
jgi:hypothetical protein